MGEVMRRTISFPSIVLRAKAASVPGGPINGIHREAYPWFVRLILQVRDGLGRSHLSDRKSSPTFPVPCSLSSVRMSSPPRLSPF